MRKVRANHRRGSAGQGLVEFALTIPILFLIAVAIGDFGRIYVSLVAGESAAREAADYGAFDDPTASHFTIDPADPQRDTTCTGPGGLWLRTSTVAEMKRRASVAVDGVADATDPAFFACALEDHTAQEPWASTCNGQLPGQDDATCGWVVHVIVTFDFHTTLDFPPFPSTVTIIRHSRYAASALPAGAPPGT